MVWLHGGGLSAGTPNTYDARRLVTGGRVIFVGVEFRLNVFGFFGSRGLKDSGTFGFLDQQAALRWVRRNISAFGGDPRNVTVFGESGGGISTCAQLVSPLASGLIDKVIMQSGSCSLSWPKNGPALGQPAGAFFEPLETIQTRGVEAAAELGCSAEDPDVELECLRNLPAERLARVAGRFYAAAYGTPLIPIVPAKALEWGVYNRIPVITGHTRNESRAVASAFELTGHPITNESYPSLLLDAFGNGMDVVLQHYPLPSYGSGALAWSAVYTDRMFACPQLRDARQLARRVPTFVYEFADPHGIGLIPFPPDLPSGASHSSELPLLFDLADGPIDIGTGKKIPLSDEQKALANLMIGYWTQFARTGNPNFSGALPWPAYMAHDQANALVLAPGDSMLTLSNTGAEHQCGFWEPFVERGFNSRKQ
jgi:para-nitrobenzyl esterase